MLKLRHTEPCLLPLSAVPEKEDIQRPPPHCYAMWHEQGETPRDLPAATQLGQAIDTQRLAYHQAMWCQRRKAS